MTAKDPMGLELDKSTGQVQYQAARDGIGRRRQSRGWLP